MPVVNASVSGLGGGPPPEGETGLDFTQRLNGDANADIRMLWAGADMVDRLNQTIIWKAQYAQQPDGYYGLTWFSPLTGGWDSGDFSRGTHPWPAADGTYNGSGYGQTGDAGASGNYWMEIAGLGASIDKIALPMTPMQMVPGLWYVQAATAEVVGPNVVERFYPDVENFPGSYIENTRSVASIPTPADPVFYHGASVWTVQFTNSNSETAGCILRGLMQYSRGMTIAEIEAKAAMTTDDTADPDVWYSNINPTPADITDKSGQGHDPVWHGNGIPPDLWEA